MDEEIRRRYTELVEAGRIEFITFHQSYGYEEFVEGLRPETGSPATGGENSVGFRLVPTDGVLKRIAERARGAAGPFDLASRNVFKMGLGNPGNNEEYRAIFNECIENGYILLGKGGEVDWSDPRFDDDEEVKKSGRRFAVRPNRRPDIVTINVGCSDTVIETLRGIVPPIPGSARL